MPLKDWLHVTEAVTSLAPKDKEFFCTVWRREDNFPSCFGVGKELKVTASNRSLFSPRDTQ